MRDHGVLLKTWRRGGDVVDECVGRCERAMRDGGNDSRGEGGERGKEETGEKEESEKGEGREERKAGRKDRRLE
jgi:hypothetical protein